MSCRIANDQSGFPGQVPPDPPNRSHSLVERRSPADIESLVTRHRPGVILKRLADGYGINIRGAPRLSGRAIDTGSP